MSDKSFLQSQEKPMDAAAFVDRASEMAATLEDYEAIKLGSRPIARKRAARFIGVPASLLHSLRYRRPKTIAADVYYRLCAASERHAEMQIRIFQNEIAEARARHTGADDHTLRAVETALEQARTLLKGEIGND